MTVVVPTYNWRDGWVDVEHKLLYVEYRENIPHSVITAFYVPEADEPYWRKVYWDFFANGGDTNDIRYYESGSGGSLEEGIEACDFTEPIEVWISPDTTIKGKFVNAVFLPKPKNNPFEEAQETSSYIYCKECNEFYDDYMESEPCEHICLSDDGEQVYRDSGKRVND
nr:MAG TPA: PR domain zinc finger protein-binding domain, TRANSCRIPTION [Caudoviricetes sp.]